MLHALGGTVARVPDRAALVYFDGRADVPSTRLARRRVRAAPGARRLRPRRPARPGAAERAAVRGRAARRLEGRRRGRPGQPDVPGSASWRTCCATPEVAALVCAESAWDSYIRRTAADSPVRLAFTASEFDLQTRDDPRVLTDPERRPAEDAEDLLTAARAAQGGPADGESGLPALPQPGDIALISYTSGTTGTPKGALNTHGNIAYNAHRQDRTLGLSEGAKVFALAPLFHITGMVCELSAGLAAGRTRGAGLPLRPRRGAGRLPRAPPRHTWSAPRPPTWRCWPVPGTTAEDFASFEAAQLRRRAAAAGRGRGVRGALRPLHPQRLRAHRVHRAVRQRAARAARRPSTRSPAPSRSACPGPTSWCGSWTTRAGACRSASRARSRCAARWSCPATGSGPRSPPPPCPDGELHTGDIGFMDDRRLALRGRPQEGHDQRLRLQGLAARGRGRPLHPSRGARGGRRRRPRRLPRREREGVRQPAARTRPSTRPGSIAYCREQLAAYKYPREVEILPELPKTATGKILRRELRATASRHDTP